MKQLVHIIRTVGGVEIQHSSSVKDGRTEWLVKFPHRHWAFYNTVRKDKVGLFQKRSWSEPDHIYVSATEFERDPLKYINMVRGVEVEKEVEGA